jgi:hypothetical protein
MRKRKSSKMSDDDLTWAVEASAAQIALRWMVLQWDPPGSSKSLELMISDFSADALAEMCAAYPTLRNAPEELRWLTYFKGLISADTHPRDQMLTAIDAVRRRQADPTVKLSTKSVLEQENVGPYETNPTRQADALAAIELALSKASDDGRL